MPNVRAEIFKQIAEDIRMRVNGVNRDIQTNRYNLRVLSENQKNLKKKRSELYRMYAEFVGKGEKK